MMRLLCCLGLVTTLHAADVRLVDGKMVAKGIDPKHVRVVVAGGTEAEVAERPALGGEWTTQGDSHTFTPKYPFKAGLTYRVFVNDKTHIDVSIPAAKPGKPPTLLGFYPSAKELPENTFRFYLQFDRSMPRGDAYKYIAVLKADGKPVQQPFLELDDELWNAEQTRLTLLIDPGRIKRELKPIIDLGPVFMAKQEYTLVVDGRWPTLEGAPLGKDYRRKVSITQRLDGELDAKKWKIQPPTNKKSAVTVQFDRPMDYALLQRTLSVLDAKGQPVEGQGQLGVEERSWVFTPKKPLTKGDYRLRIDTILEDTCGNAIGRAFEVDLTAPAKPSHRPPTVDLPFVVRDE